MKEATGVWSATVLVARFPRQQNFPLVRLQKSIAFGIVVVVVVVVVVVGS